MSGIREQTYDAVSGAVNDTFGDAMMDVPDAPLEPFWRRHWMALALAALVALVLGWLLWSRRKKNKPAATPPVSKAKTAAAKAAT